MIENAKGNLQLTDILFNGVSLSSSATTIGAIESDAHDSIFWMITDQGNAWSSDTGKVDMIVSFNVKTGTLTYHIVSVNDGGSVNTTLNFNPSYLITGINIIGDLLFFTDYYNQPRVINVKKSYLPPSAGIDQFTAESILVIKRPPTSAPSFTLTNAPGQENFIKDRFICFAYRYRYADGEYSATSQWSAPAFVPDRFNLSPESYLNEGMSNVFNKAVITYDSGGDLVVGVDLLFKEADSGIIRVIEKLDKKTLGLINNSTYQYEFSNSKIYTILPESELLRLYDNVPLKAMAQTLMGNRLMYGQYSEGFPMLSISPTDIDSNQYPTNIDYYTSLISEEVGVSSLTDGTATGSYGIVPGVPASIANSVVTVDFTGISLEQGSLFSLNIRVQHDSWAGFTPTPTSATNSGTVEIGMSFLLPTTYASVYQFATSSFFQQSVGTALNILPVYSSSGTTSCDGTTLTDQFNCVIPSQVGVWHKFASGINNVGESIKIITSPGSPTIGFQLLAVKFVNNLLLPSQTIYEYFKVSSATATFRKNASPSSLHSNRDYEVGIIYMDEYKRATTTLVSVNNTEHIPCSFSKFKNSIRVTIPITQVAPYWASSYKFVVRSNASKYETVYSSIYYLDQTTGDAYLLLQGENARKVQQGDRLIVKSDTNGPLGTCAYATVLEKEAKAEGDITLPNSAVSLPGVYMKLKPTSYTIENLENSVITSPMAYEFETMAGEHPIATIYCGTLNPSTGLFEDYSIPVGSIIKLYIKFSRDGSNSGSCEQRVYTIEKTFVSSSDYANMYDWWIGDNVTSVLDDGIWVTNSVSGPPNNIFYNGIGSYYSDGFINNAEQNYQYRFQRFPSTPGAIGYQPDRKHLLALCIKGTRTCGTSGAQNAAKTSRAWGQVQVYRSNGTMIFETEPVDTTPDIFFENDQSFSIVNGNHMGNVTNQDIAAEIPAVIDTDFYNCFSFGNGAESYKFRDSIVGRTFDLGNRVSAVSAQDYKDADRFSDVTYSGIYNPESNVNRLNEFNLGLINYKHLESSFGRIGILDGRQTDLMVLQEDKISYVLAGKNLLSDAAAGGAITSVPEVLGTQIARVENYGISSNPESYAKRGADRFFTDERRGAVLQISGGAYSTDQLKVISETGMRTWFRDMFNSKSNKQKLGGFDPYLNEYVLSANDKLLPSESDCLNCGVSQTISITSEAPTSTYCTKIGTQQGNVLISYNSLGATNGNISITVNYDGGTYTSGTIAPLGTGNFFFVKSRYTVREIPATVIVTLLSGTIGVIDVTVGCPTPEEIGIVEIVLTDNSDFGKTTHAQYRYSSSGFVSPYQSRYIDFMSGTSNPLVSWFHATVGQSGYGAYPSSGDTMRIVSNKLSTDTFQFTYGKNKFRYLRTGTLYSNTPSNIATILAASTEATPVHPSTSGASNYYAEFTVPSFSSGLYLYMIWDLRSPNDANLCYLSEPGDTCCDCNPCDSECVSYSLDNLNGSTDLVVRLLTGLCGATTGYQDITVSQGYTMTVCANNGGYEIRSGVGVVTAIKCDCSPCSDMECVSVLIKNYPGNGSCIANYTDCAGDSAHTDISEQEAYVICMKYNSDLHLTGGLPDVSMYEVCNCESCPDELCRSWVITNVGVGGCTVSYTDCSSVSTTVDVPYGSHYLACAMRPTFPLIVSGTADVTLYNECGCTERIILM